MKTYPDTIQHIGRSRGRTTPLLRNSSGVSNLAIESPLAIEINGVPTATLVCTPGSGDELVAGWCFGQGYLDDVSDIARISCGNTRATIMLRRSLPGGHEWREQVTAGFDASLIRYPERPPGSAPKRDDFVIEAGKLIALDAELRERFGSRQHAGHFEHAGATDGASILVSTYDVDRFNALDKLIGWSVLASEPIDSMVLSVTGRLCAASVFRIARSGARIVVSDRDPSAQAVKIAQGCAITLVGGAGTIDPVIYTHPWRIDRS